MSRTIQWCDGPTPSASRPPVPAWTDSAWRASAIGCCACSGTTAVPSSIRDVPSTHQRHHRQAVEVVGHLRHPRGVEARGLSPLDVVDQLRDLARHVAAFGPDHHAKTHLVPLPDPFGRQLAHLWTRSSSGVPVGNTAAAPASSSFGTSACGIVPPTTTAMSPASRCTQRVDGAGGQRDVRAGEDRKPHQRNVFLHRDRHDVLDALPDAGVDHLEAGVAQRARDDLGAAVVAVEPGFGDEYADGHQNTTGCWNSPHTAFSAETISPTVQ